MAIDIALHPVLFVVAGILSVLFAKLAYDVYFTPLRNVPGPFLARLTRLWELAAVCKGDFHWNTIRLHQKHGPVVRLAPNKYDFDSAEAVKTIYSLTRTFPKSAYYEAFADPTQDRALFNCRDTREHARLRRTQASLYTMSTMKTYEPAVDEQTNVLLSTMISLATVGMPVRLVDLLQYYAFDVIGSITFGEPYNLMKNYKDEHGVIGMVHRNMVVSSRMGVIPEVWPPLIKLLKALRLPSPKVILDTAKRYLKQYRAERKGVADEAQAKTFATKVIELEASGKMTASDAESVCVSNVIAGSDTTAIALSSLFFYVYTHPNVLGKLRHEMDQAAKDGKISDPVTFQAGQDLVYMQAVIKEALRLHPAVGASLARLVPGGGVEMHGHFFPEGTEVGVNAWGLNYNPAVYGPDASAFRPERWFESSEGTSNSSISQFAFGAGSRTCIGKNISLLEMTKVVPQIVRNFDIHFEPSRSSWSMRMNWFVKPDFHVRVTARVKS